MKVLTGIVRHCSVSLTTVVALCTTTSALADGTEQLGDRSIPIASGSDVICAGTGLGGPNYGLTNIAEAFAGQEPGLIEIFIPENVTVQQVLLYWEGHQSTARGQGPTDTIVLDPGGVVTGDRIGGPTLFFTAPVDGWDSTYRADITDLNIVQPGPNLIGVSGTDFDVANNGAGIVVIVDDGMNEAEIQLKDGNDVAFINFAPPLNTTEPVTYNFAPSAVDRVAEVCMFFGSVSLEDPSGGFGRPTVILVGVDDNPPAAFNDVLDNSDGAEWDTFRPEVLVPAGATSVTVQALSQDSGRGPFAGNLPASFTWMVSSLALVPPCTGQIGDFIWKDLNGNGIQDPGEPGIPGVRVQLLQGCRPGAEVIGEVITDENGQYQFVDLCEGDYQVVIDPTTVPDGLEETLPNQGNDQDDSDCVNGQVCVTLPRNGTIDNSVDCGFRCTGAIGDRIWKDLNGNGVQDPGEPGIEGVRIQLFAGCAGGGQVLVGEVITGPDGSYSFEGLCGGDYLVVVDGTTVPGGLEETIPNQGNDEDDSDCIDGEVCVTLPGDGAVDNSIDCGFRCTGAIGDRIWEDLNGNGIQDPGEPGLPGVRVQIYRGCAGGGQVFIDEVISGPDGGYLFEGLCADDYLIVIDGDTVPDGLEETIPNQGPDTDDSDCIDGEVCVTLPGDGTVDLDTDCGFVRRGGCCLENGECIETTQADCNEQGGAWQGPGTTCDEIECPPIKGACCFDDGSCAVMTLEECLGDGGAYQGDGTDCAGVDCGDADGACCLPEGICVVNTQAMCNALNGLYQGDGVSCEDTVCQVIKGACCFDDGSCAVITLELCIEGGGAYQGDGTTCQSADCPIPDGACCFDDGSCLELTQEDCNNQAGSYQGNDSRCDGANCLLTKGACCFGDGSCAVLTLDACVSQGGAYQGDGVTCQDANCPIPDGACCFEDGSCLELTQADCIAQGGSYQGNDSRCDGANCPPIKGACCFDDGSCTVVALKACIAGGGAYQGDGTTCQTANCTTPEGACCLESGDCVETTQADCLAQGGSYQGNGTDCASASCPVQKGACCFTDGSCSVGTLEDCVVGGGAYQGDDTTCQTVSCIIPDGACCLPGGDCIEATQAQCNGQGGSYQGNGTNCAGANCPVDKGACCFDNGACAVVTLDQCVTSGGAYQGNDVTCLDANCTIPDGACCLEDGSCEVLTQAECNAQGGAYQGNDSRCAGVNCPVVKGACCFEDDGSCAVLTLEDCIAQGGAYEGDGTVCQTADCPPAEGACCLEDGSCVVLTQAACNAQGGAYQGNNTSCSPETCPIDKFPCCFSDGACAVLTDQECDAAGGETVAGTNCADADCPQPNGACCFPDLGGTCTDGLTQEDCNAQGGDYQGDGTTCDSVGDSCLIKAACCFPDGSCIMVPVLDGGPGCTDIGGEFQGAGVSCGEADCEQPTGGCCFEIDGSCVELTQADCAAQGGAYQGNFTDCDPNQCVQLKGACCFDDGSCIVVPAGDFITDCIDLGGIYQGDGTFCSPERCPGACCLPNGDCVENVSRVQCQLGLDGVWQGLGTTCADVDCELGACCLPSGACLDQVTLGECDAADGIDFEIAVSCADKDCDVPCCLPDCGCIEVSLDACNALNGIPGEVGQSCDDFECPGACCLPGGMCVDSTGAECDALGGICQGLGTTCDTTDCCIGRIGDRIWRDNNGNGCQDPGEPGIDGVRVRLFLGCDENNNILLDEVFTDTNGFYQFTDLCAGEYLVKVDENTVPSGLFETVPNAGDDDCKDSDCENGRVCVILPADDSETDCVDCGFSPPLDCCESGDKPRDLLFRYTGDDCSATTNDQEGSVDCETFGPLPDLVYIIAGKQSDCDNNADELYFEGFVGLNETFVVQPPGGDDFSSNTYFCIYDGPGGDLLQTVNVHTSCSKDLFTGDQFASLFLVACNTQPVPFTCDGKIVEMTMIWGGNGPVTITAWDGDVGSDLIGNFGPLNPGDEVTVGPLNGPNDSFWEVFDANTGQKIGESKFHRSCSDDEMNGSEDCGNPQGNGKGNDSGFINDWILEGLVDEAGGEFDCSSL